MGQQQCIGVSLVDSADEPDGTSDGMEGEGGLCTAHAQEVRKKVMSLSEKYGWRTDPEVEDALARTDLPSYRRILKKHRTAEPCWDEDVHGAFSGDSRVQRLAAGGFVFEDLCVYTVLVQLLHPALRSEGCHERAPRVLDVGCGTGFLTAVLARLVAPRGGTVVAIDMFARQIEHAQRTMSACCPELLPNVTFAVANGLEYRDPGGAPFDAIAVACQAAEVPQALVRQLAPGGYLVAPVGRPAPKDKGKAGPYHKYWLVKKGPDGKVVFSGRAGPIGVNFVPLLPPAKPAQDAAAPAAQTKPAAVESSSPAVAPPATTSSATLPVPAVPVLISNAQHVLPSRQLAMLVSHAAQPATSRTATVVSMRSGHVPMATVITRGTAPPVTTLGGGQFRQAGAVYIGQSIPVIAQHMNRPAS